MNKNKLILFTGLIVFAGLVVFALWRELSRNEAEIQAGISGVVKLAPGMGSGMVKTDNAHLLLFEPQTLQLVAINTLNPFVPPLTFHVGQSHARVTQPLQGAYRLLIVTDKDGSLERPVPGEYIGELTPPIPLGTEEYEYVLTQPFRSLPRELLQSSQAEDDPSKVIHGTVSVDDALKSKVSSTDRLIVMLFDPKQTRPVAFKIIPHFQDGQAFSIGQSNAMPGQTLKGAYSLRIITDKNNQPFESAPGEVVGRSTELVELGTKDFFMILNQEYQR